MQRNELVISAKDVHVWIGVNNRTYKFETATQSGYSFTRTVENIFAISNEDSIATKGNSKQYNFDLSIQSGEYHQLLNAINGDLPATADLYASFLDVPQFTITFAWNMLDLLVPEADSVTIQNVLCSSDSGSAAANDTSTLVSLSLQGTSIVRNVKPITL